MIHGLSGFTIALQFNFVGRLLGPRGNSLKRVEATTGCRVYIRGKGSIKDPDKVSSLVAFLFGLIILEICKFYNND